MTLDVGDRLPARSLDGIDGDEEVPLRRPRRGNTVLFLGHGPGCEGCRGFVRGLLQEAAGELEDWDTVLLVAPASAPAPATGDGPAEDPAATWLRDLPSPALAALDPGGEIRRRCGVDDGQVAVLVADRWGQIYHRSEASGAEGLSGADEIVMWSRYMTVQCPECGVPDEPPGMGRWHREPDEVSPSPRRGPRPSAT